MSLANTKKTFGKALACVLAAALLLTAAGCGSTTTLTQTNTATITATATATSTATVTTPTTATATVSGPTATVTTTIERVTLNVSAAASLSKVIEELNAAYTKDRPWVNIVLNTGSSGTLQVQIENGAPCDVFLSAAAAQMNNLENKGLLADGTRRNLLNNKIVLVVPSNSTLGLTGFADLALPKVTKIAIGDPASVPAGAYAQQTFDLFGITSQVQSKYVLGADVTAVLAYVESGSVDAGIVYATDALGSNKVKVIASAPDTINALVVYPVAIIKSSKVKEAAQEYINFLASAEAMAIFEKYGFSKAV